MILALLAILVVGPAIPNVTITPGATRDLSLRTVCTTRWGTDHRAVTLTMKKQVAKAYGLPWEKHALVEFDHEIPRSLAGADDVLNLWPQPWAGAWNAHQKDRLEVFLGKQVCSGALSLAAAQNEIRGDWRISYRKHFGEPK